MNQVNPQTPENIFKNKVGELAYNYIRASYPTLMPFVITLKIDTTDLQKGNALGVFILKHGKDVLYIPVVIVGGSVVSCEMVYNKTNNTFTPLINKEITKIIKTNELVDNTLINNPRINTTFNMFRSMLRPPISERMGYASVDVTDGIVGLPNSYKEALYNTITKSKDMLLKVSAHYSVEELYNLLKPTEESSVMKSSSPSLITIDDLNSGSKSYISKEAAEQVLSKGYDLVKKETYKNFLYRPDDINKLLSVAYKFREVSINKEVLKNPIAADVVLMQSDGSMGVCKHAIIDGGNIFIGDGEYIEGCSMNTEVVISGPSRPVQEKHLLCNGGTPIRKFLTEGITKVGEDTILSIWVPNRQGYYTRVFKDYLHDSKRYNITKSTVNGIDNFSIKEDTSSPLKSKSEKTITVNINPNLINSHISYSPDGDPASIELTSMIRDVVIHVPETSYVLISHKRATSTPVSSIKAILKSLINPALKLSVSSDSHEYTIKDNNIIKTMQKEADLADYIHSKYDVHPDQIYDLIDTVSRNTHKSTDFLVLEKQAASFDMSTGNPQGMVQQNLAQQTANPALTAFQPNNGAPNLGGNGLPPIIDSDILDVYANGFNKSMLDIGILASLYNNDDIKGYLLDFMPQFIDTVSYLGRSILIFNIYKEKLQADYGSGEYYNIISVMRKIFTSLAEIIRDLDIYLHNNSIGKGTQATTDISKVKNQSLLGNRIANNI